MVKHLTISDILEKPDWEQLIGKTSFEEGLALLEALVEQVESGKLPLDQAIGAYERGVFLLNHLRSLITGAEEKLKILEKSAGSTRAKKSPESV